jgi:hypothetical protein
MCCRTGAYGCDATAASAANEQSATRYAQAELIPVPQKQSLTLAKSVRSHAGLS